MSKMKVLITGANGFVGLRLVELMAAHPTITPIALVRSTAAAKKMEALGCDARLGDLKDIAALEGAILGCTAVVHLAHGDDASALFETGNIVSTAVKHKVTRFVHISSIAVHGQRPNIDCESEATATIGTYRDSYCNAKVESEKTALQAYKQSSLPVIVLRPTIIYGRNSPFVQQIFDAEHRGDLTLVDGGKGVCNAVFVDDVCGAILTSLTASETAIGQAYFINGRKAISWGRFILRCVAEVNAKPVIGEIESSQILKEFEALRNSFEAKYGTYSGNLEPTNSLVQKIVKRLKRKFLRSEAEKFGEMQSLRQKSVLYNRVLRETVKISFNVAKAKEYLGWEPKFEFDAGNDPIVTKRPGALS
jgi:2-alkyl-3-oxoalkanoate reductase